MKRLAFAAPVSRVENKGILLDSDTMRSPFGILLACVCLKSW